MTSEVNPSNTPHDAAAQRLPILTRTIAEFREKTRELIEAQPLSGAEADTVRVGFVPTMGALHDGHGTLVRTARAANDVVAVSIFVNPLQFNDPVDYERYPRTLDADLELLGLAGADIVFAPEESEMYPDGDPLVKVTSGKLGEKFEGASRPGHFDGMLAVVSKLLHIAQPSLLTSRKVEFSAFFGQKDAQQLAIIRRMVLDLAYNVEIQAVPIVRSDRGLALSSRNQFLSEAEAEAALVLSRALFLLKSRADAHEPLNVEDAVALIDAEPLVALDYLEVVDPSTLEVIGVNCQDTPFTGQALALVAAKVGPVRLIDNMPLGS